MVFIWLVIRGVISLLLVPSQLYVWDDPMANMANIREHESLFRMGIGSGLLGFLACLILPLILYKLLNPVNKTAAVLMVTLAVASVPITFANTGHLPVYNDGNLIARLFWGAWLFPFGYLVYRSGFLPKLLGALLLLGSLGYAPDLLTWVPGPGPRQLLV